MGPCGYRWDDGGYETYTVYGEGNDWSTCQVIAFILFATKCGELMFLYVRGLVEYVRSLSV